VTARILRNAYALLLVGLLACDPEPASPQTAGETPKTSPPAPTAAPPTPPPAPAPAAATPEPTSAAPFRFVDRAAEAGITLLNTSGRVGTDKLYLMETIGTGAALLDYDGDGLLDVFIANGCELEDHKPVRGGGSALYRNLGGMKFADVTEKAHARVDGMGFGALAQDFDNDGDPDLFITRWDTNVLLRNNGDGTFSDVSAGRPAWWCPIAGAAPPPRSTTTSTAISTSTSPPTSPWARSTRRRGTS
jgi:hypothetical protein